MIDGPAVIALLLIYLLIGANTFWIACAFRVYLNLDPLQWEGFMAHALGWPAVILVAWPVAVPRWYRMRRGVVSGDYCPRCGASKGMIHEPGCSNDRN